MSEYLYFCDDDDKHWCGTVMPPLLISACSQTQVAHICALVMAPVPVTMAINCRVMAWAVRVGNIRDPSTKLTVCFLFLRKEVIFYVLLHNFKSALQQACATFRGILCIWNISNMLNPWMLNMLNCCIISDECEGPQELRCAFVVNSFILTLDSLSPDINECLNSSNNCATGQVCINTRGSFYCRRKKRCGMGYELQEDSSCQGFSLSITGNVITLNMIFASSNFSVSL